jgi:hypothetical protein
LLIVGAVVFACSSPDGSVDEFTFTPEPYFLLPNPYGTPWALGVGTERKSHQCDLYQTDVVSGLVRPDHVESLARWAERRGFEAKYTVREPVDWPTPERAGEPTREPLNTLLIISVPRGSAHTALPLIQKQPGVVTMDESGLGGSLWPSGCPALEEPDWYCELFGLDQVSATIEREHYPPLERWLAEHGHAVIHEQDSSETVLVDPDAARLTSAPAVVKHLLIGVPPGTADTVADLIAAQPDVLRVRSTPPDERWVFPDYSCE